MSYRTMSYRTAGRWTMGVLVLLAASSQAAFGQVVINEIVKDVRDENAADIADTREFIELYNAGNAPVDIGGWTMNYWDMSPADPPGSSYTAFVDTIPAGTMLTAGDFYVLGASANVPNVDQPLGPSALFLDLNSVFELRDAGGQIKDAVALDIQRGREFAALGPNHAAFIGQGVWGQNISYNTVAGETNVSQSASRFRDGVTTNNNGRDFGMLPLTPGASNNRPQGTVYNVPNVDAVAVGTRDTSVYASFKLPYVINPTAVGPAGLGGQNVNPKVIPASPQGGRALMAWDETGGGNAVYSYEYVNSFKLSAYIETAPLNVTDAAAAANRIRSEATMYGLGTTDPLFTTPDATGLLGTGFSSNGSTGVGWMIQRLERFGDSDFDQDLDVDGNDFLRWQQNVGLTTGATNDQGDAEANGAVNAADLNYWRVQTGSTLASYPGRVSKTVLMLVDAGNGGDSWPADQEWKVLKIFDLTGAASAWHTLGLDYDPATGEVDATYDNQTFTFNTQTGLVGNFYVGYREGLGASANRVNGRPPTYDLVAVAGAGAVPEPGSAVVALMAALGLLVTRKMHQHPQIT